MNSKLWKMMTCGQVKTSEATTIAQGNCTKENVNTIPWNFKWTRTVCSLNVIVIRKFCSYITVPDYRKGDKSD
jgi:hypothetical protein